MGKLQSVSKVFNKQGRVVPPDKPFEKKRKVGRLLGRQERGKVLGGRRETED